VITTTVVLVGLALGALLVVRHEAAARLVGPEAYKVLLQFVLVAVLGGGVSLIYQAFNRDADLRAQRARQHEERRLVLRETRQRYLRDLAEQYNVVKRARRMLRAQALVYQVGEVQPQVRVAKYDEFLQVVLDAQLSLETMTHAVRADDELFPTWNDIISSLHIADVYLRSLITEYENFLPRVDPSEVLVDLARLQVLADFIGPYRESVDFRERFVHPIQKTLGVMQYLAIAAVPGAIN
jgi:hypothetical protein